MGDTLKVKVTFLKSPTKFYVIANSAEDDLNTVNQWAEAAVESAVPTPVELFDIGDIAIAPYNDVYYRCEVKYVHQNGRITVLFIDYGNEATVKSEKIFHVPTPFRDYLTTKPPLCFEVRLCKYDTTSVDKHSEKALCSAMNKCLVHSYDMKVLSVDDSTGVLAVRIPKIEKILYEGVYGR